MIKLSIGLLVSYFYSLIHRFKTNDLKHMIFSQEMLPSTLLGLWVDWSGDWGTSLGLLRLYMISCGDTMSLCLAWLRRFSKILLHLIDLDCFFWKTAAKSLTLACTPCILERATRTLFQISNHLMETNSSSSGTCPTAIVFMDQTVPLSILILRR